jgi:acyl-CoA reductase-like NAD-dependent aldehyde dehydrogenase
VAPLHLTAAETGGVGTEQIIVALIGGLALVLVALVPVLITSAKRGASTTTPSPPGPTEATIPPEEAERLWKAIEKLRNDQRDAALWAAEERGRIEARNAEARRDIDSLQRILGDLRDRFHRHTGSPGHRSSGPDTGA